MVSLLELLERHARLEVEDAQRVLLQLHAVLRRREDDDRRGQLELVLAGVELGFGVLIFRERFLQLGLVLRPSSRLVHLRPFAVHQLHREHRHQHAVHDRPRQPVDHERRQPLLRVDLLLIQVGAADLVDRGAFGALHSEAPPLWQALLGSSRTGSGRSPKWRTYNDHSRRAGIHIHIHTTTPRNAPVPGGVGLATTNAPSQCSRPV